MSETPSTMVLYETDEKVGIITLDRADKLNAINASTSAFRPGRRPSR
jgi:enoyl-CoA hydratase/carnithine racemase